MLREKDIHFNDGLDLLLHTPTLYFKRSNEMVLTLHDFHVVSSEQDWDIQKHWNDTKGQYVHQCQEMHEHCMTAYVYYMKMFNNYILLFCCIRAKDDVNILFIQYFILSCHILLMYITKHKTRYQWNITIIH